jgi:hypothetical protein
LKTDLPIFTSAELKAASMPALLSQLTGEEWRTQGPQTAAQKFFAEYHKTVDSAGFNQGTGSRFYADDMLFHNQNNATYRGGEQMWTWMQSMFNQFSNLKHDIVASWDIQQDDGSNMLFIQMTRHVWAKDNKTDKPDVSAPTFWRCIIAKSDDPRAFGGLQYKEVWLFWDTMLLAPIMPKNATVFSTKNVAEE